MEFEAARQLRGTAYKPIVQCGSCPCHEWSGYANQRGDSGALLNWSHSSMGDEQEVSDLRGEVPPVVFPFMTEDTRFWWDAVQEQKLVFQQCRNCLKLRHPPSPSCPECHSRKWVTSEVSGLGRIYSFAVVHHPPVPGFKMPFVCALIELAEGIRMISNVVDIDHDDVYVGMPVILTFRRTESNPRSQCSANLIRSRPSNPLNHIRTRTKQLEISKRPSSVEIFAN